MLYLQALELVKIVTEKKHQGCFRYFIQHVLAKTNHFCEHSGYDII